MNSLPWQINIDTGGTFTDIFAIDPSGQDRQLKILSSGNIQLKVLEIISSNIIRCSGLTPEHFCLINNYFLQNDPSVNINSAKANGVITFNQEVDFKSNDLIQISNGEIAPILGIRLLCKKSLFEKLPYIHLSIGTTKGTNALLEEKGNPIICLFTKGFKNLMSIGDQRRPNIFQLNIKPRKILNSNTYEVNECVNAKGQIVQFVCNEEIEKIINQLAIEDKEIPIAICFKNSFKNDFNEQLTKKFLNNKGFPNVYLSSETGQTIGYLNRSLSNQVNAYLHGVFHDFIQALRDGLATENILLMRSDGHLVNIHDFHAKDLLLSGPAGGVIGAQKIGERYGIHKFISFDMGGTSTDVARYDHKHDFQYSTQIQDLLINTSCISIHTVAAGGGSICSFKHGALRVGPESAGSHPGPACYGQGGPLTITDINLLSGRLNPSDFSIPIFYEAATNALRKLLIDVKKQTSEEIDEDSLIDDLLHLANQKMADAIHEVSIRKGFDPRDYSLIGFGGAGGLHICEIAEILGIDQIILPKAGGVLSAYGISKTVESNESSLLVLERLENYIDKIVTAFNKMKLDAEKQFESNSNLVHHQRILLRVEGQEHAIEIDYENDMELTGVFKEEYQKLYGHWPKGKKIELHSLKVRSQYFQSKEKTGTFKDHTPKSSAIVNSNQMSWNDLETNKSYKGSISVSHPFSALYLNENWILTKSSFGDLKLNRIQKRKDPQVNLKSASFALFKQGLNSIADDMGTLLERTSFSVNIKERLDFSCAILDPKAQLLVNAPHIPVHLGSLGVCGRKILEQIKLNQGDVVITNHPAYGGSHLPDITLMKAVYSQKNELLGYVMNRAHHSEIGGLTPGSMPPNAKNLAEEGVVFKPQYLVKKGISNAHSILNILQNSPYPSRSPKENILDLEAALASLELGDKRLRAMSSKMNHQVFLSFMQNLQDHTGKICHELIQKLPFQSIISTEFLDDGHRIIVNLTKRNGRLQISFKGTSAVHPGNFNANESIVQSAVLYVLRILIDQDIPLNEGLLQHVDIHLFDSFIHPNFPENPTKCPAVVGGNTETSQRIVDTLLKGFEVAACSQGTMNNLVFGNESFGYYETIGGGVGATEGQHGASGFHQHMTNTKITDPEILEHRYPVELVEFDYHHNSGGAGKWQGGNGLSRKIKFLEEMTLTIIAQHRVQAPYGIKGGKDGKCGEQFLIRANGEKINLTASETITVYKDDIIHILTPGGGGFGKKVL